MSLKAENIKLVHRNVGSKHVITSPDVPELHVSHSDAAVARASVQGALDMLARMQDRLAAKKDFEVRHKLVA